jgi:hypothetical protein
MIFPAPQQYFAPEYRGGVGEIMSPTSFFMVP